MLLPKEIHLPLFSRATLSKQVQKRESYDPITHTLRAYSVMDWSPAASPQKSRNSSPDPPHQRTGSLPPLAPYLPPRYQQHRVNHHLANPVTGATLWYHKSPPFYVKPPREVQPYDITYRQHPTMRPRVSVDIRKELQEVRQRKV